MEKPELAAIRSSAHCARQEDRGDPQPRGGRCRATSGSSELSEFWPETVYNPLAMCYSHSVQVGVRQPPSRRATTGRRYTQQSIAATLAVCIAA
jgi:hypothetical protein